MPAPQPSSRQQYQQYRREVLERRRKGEEENGKLEHGQGGTKHLGPHKSTKRHRSFTRLFVHFWRMLHGHRRVLLLSLLTLSISTLLGLIPLYGTKLVFDNVLGGRALPR